MPSAVTIETAPRTADQLAKLGRFALRTLAIQLGRMGTEEQKSAFMSLDNDRMATELLSDLLKIDKDKAGPSAPVVATATVVRTPVAEEKPVVRAPSNGATAPKSQETPARPETPSVGVAQVVQKLTDIEVALRNELVEIKDRLDAIEGEQEYTAKVSRANNSLAIIGMNLALILAEEVVKGPREEVLKAAIGDFGAVVATLAKLDPKRFDGVDAVDDEAEEEAGG